MPAALSATPSHANFDVASECASSRTNVRAKSFTSEVMRIAHSIWKLKIRRVLSDFCGVCPRTVDHWQAGERAISTEAFLTLLESAETDEGADYLNAFMTQVPAAVRHRWWDRQVTEAKLDRAERRKANAEQQSRQLRLELNR